MSDTEAVSAEPVVVDRFATLTYTDRLAPCTIVFADGLIAGKLIGQKCPVCERVYLPGRGYCPIDVVKMGPETEVEVSDKGTVTGYTIITPVRYYGQTKTEPFVYASVLLDGASGVLGGQEITGIPIAEVREGLRVAAVWKPPSERTLDGHSTRGWGTVEGSIESFVWTGEPDAPLEAYREHVI